MNVHFHLLLLSLLLSPELAEDKPEQTSDTKKLSRAIENCIINYVASAEADTPIAEVRRECIEKSANDLLPNRVLQEKATQENSFVITPHRQNYMLPVTYNTRPNQEPYIVQNAFPGINEPIDELEAKFQFSIKVPIVLDDLFVENDGLYFGFTLKSLWQVYNKEASAPFRETNYQPEIFYQLPLPLRMWGGTFFAQLGFEHESNGRTQLLSRSWNRLYAGLGFARKNWVIYLQPWYRLPEDRKKTLAGETLPPPEGDDNPDIHHYYGYFELSAVYKADIWQASTKTRQNFSTGNGAFELGISFPLYGKVRGYAQWFNGYGESLIDYNHRSNRFGIGLMLTDWL